MSLCYGRKSDFKWGYLLWGDIVEIVKFWFEDKDVTATEIKANVTKIHCNNKSYILKEKGSINEKKLY